MLAHLASALQLLGLDERLRVFSRKTTDLPAHTIDLIPKLGGDLLTCLGPCDQLELQIHVVLVPLCSLQRANQVPDDSTLMPVERVGEDRLLIGQRFRGELKAPIVAGAHLRSDLAIGVCSESDEAGLAERLEVGYELADSGLVGLYFQLLDGLR